MLNFESNSFKPEQSTSPESYTFEDFCAEMQLMNNKKEQEVMLGELGDDEKRLEKKTFSLFGKLEKHFRKNIAPAAMFLLLNGLSSKALAQEFENKNPELSKPKLTEKLSSEEYSDKHSTESYDPKVNLPNNIEGSFSQHRDEFINLIKRMKSMGYEIKVTNDIISLDTNELTIGDSINEKEGVDHAMGQLAYSINQSLNQNLSGVFRANDLSPLFYFDKNCFLTPPGLMGCNKEIEVPGFFLEVTKENDSQDNYSVVINDWRGKVFETNLSVNENVMIRELGHNYMISHFFSNQAHGLEVIYDENNARNNRYQRVDEPIIVRTPHIAKIIDNLEERANIAEKNVTRIEKQMVNAGVIQRIKKAKNHLNSHWMKAYVKEMQPDPEIIPLFKSMGIEIGNQQRDIIKQLNYRCEIEVVPERLKYKFFKGGETLSLDYGSSILNHGLQINGMIETFSCSVPSEGFENTPKHGYYKDKYGNGILYTVGDSLVEIIVNHPAALLGKLGPEKNFREFNFDLTPMGNKKLGDFRGVLYEKVQQPVALVGENTEYAIFSNASHRYIKEQFGERFPEIVNGIERFEELFGYQHGELVKNIFILDSDETNSFYSESNPDSIYFLTKEFEHKTSVTDIAFHECGHLLDYWLGKNGAPLSQSDKFIDLFYSLRSDDGFFHELNESSFLPNIDKEAGHSQDNEKEFFASFLNSLTHPNWKDTMIYQHDAKFRSDYFTSLMEMRTLIQTNVKSDAPILQILDDRIAIMSDLTAKDDAGIPLTDK